MIVQSEIADKKKAILTSTLKLIKEHGLHGTTVSMISKKAGVASGTIYHYFPGKDDIIMELNCQVRKEMVEAMLAKQVAKKNTGNSFLRDGLIFVSILLAIQVH